jgi:hypothetical protein
MGETLELFRPLCNGSVRVESRTEKLTGDAGLLLLLEALDRTALIEPLAAQLDAPRRVLIVACAPGEGAVVKRPARKPLAIRGSNSCSLPL